MLVRVVAEVVVVAAAMALGLGLVGIIRLLLRLVALDPDRTALAVGAVAARGARGVSKRRAAKVCVGRRRCASTEGQVEVEKDSRWDGRGRMYTGVDSMDVSRRRCAANSASEPGSDSRLAGWHGCTSKKTNDLRMAVQGAHRSAS